MVHDTIILWQDVGPCCEQTRAAFEVGLSLDQGQGVYSGWSDVVVSSQLRLCHTCIIDVMPRSCQYDADLYLQGYVSDVDLYLQGHKRVMLTCIFKVIWV